MNNLEHYLNESKTFVVLLNDGTNKDEIIDMILDVSDDIELEGTGKTPNGNTNITFATNKKSLFNKVKKTVNHDDIEDVYSMEF